MSSNSNTVKLVVARISRSERLACSSEIMAAYLPQNRHYYQSPLLKDLLQQKTRIVSTKLEVVALAITERLGIWTRNHKRIEEDQGMLAYMLEKLSRGVNYGSRGHDEKRVFYEQIFELRKQVRDEDVEC